MSATSRTALDKFGRREENPLTGPAPSVSMVLDLAREVEALEAQVEKANRLLEIGDRMAAKLLALDAKVKRAAAENARLEARVKELERGGT